MRVLVHGLVAAALLVTLAIAPASAGRRVALVIGNSNYETVAKLTNPSSDAAAVAASLKAAGFDEVRLVDDLGQGKFLRALRDFTTAVSGSETAVIYYAGHGVEVDGRNYLVPTDAVLAQAKDVEFEAVSLEAVRSSVGGASKLRVVILDACRNNPFQLAVANGKRSISRGLARIEPGANELVAYAAKEGTTANDGGESANSPYAAALVKYLAEPGLDVRLLFGRVRDDVLASTSGTQEPFIYGTLGGDTLYLNGPSKVAAAEPAPVTAPALAPTKQEALSEEAQLWPTVEKTTSCGVLQSFIDRYAANKSIYIDFALARRNELNCTALAAPAAPVAVEPAPVPAPADQQAALAPPPVPEPAAVASRTLTPNIVPVGKWAEGATFDGKSLWIAESGQRSIVQLSNNGEVLRRATVGRLPVGMASLPDGRVYALVQTDRVVWQETPGSAKGRRLTTIKGDCPQAMAAGTEALWVLTWPDCSSGNSRVIRIDPATGNQQPGNLLGGWGQAIATGHGKVWVAHPSGPGLSIIDPQSMQVEQSAINGASLWSIAASTDGLFVGGRLGDDNAQGVVVSVDPATNQELHRLSVSELIIALTADDQSVVAIGDKGTIWVASAKDLTLQGVFTLSIGAYRPSSALILDGRLVVVAQQYQGENGAVLAVSDWR